MAALPTVLNRASGPGAVLSLAVDPDLDGFRGHFPGDPVLPGVVQVHWAIHFGVEAFGELGRFRGIEQLKFQAVIRPGEVLELRLALDPDGGRGRGLRFEYLGGGVRKSSGTIRFSVREREG